MQCVVKDNVKHHVNWFWTHVMLFFFIKVCSIWSKEQVLNFHCSVTSCGWGTVLSAYFDHLYFQRHIAWPVYGMCLVLKMGLSHIFSSVLKLHEMAQKALFLLFFILILVELDIKKLPIPLHFKCFWLQFSRFVFW